MASVAEEAVMNRYVQLALLRTWIQEKESMVDQLIEEIEHLNHLIDDPRAIDDVNAI